MFRLVSACFSLFFLTEHCLTSRNLLKFYQPNWIAFLRLLEVGVHNTGTCHVLTCVLHSWCLSSGFRAGGITGSQEQEQEGAIQFRIGASGALWAM
jgi:hypothetical protein